MSDAQFPFGKMPKCRDTNIMQHSALLWLKKVSRTRASKKSHPEWCPDKDHNPFRTYIRQLWVLEKVRSVFTGGDGSWIKSRATGVSRDPVQGLIIWTWQPSLLWRHLSWSLVTSQELWSPSIHPHLFFLIASNRKLFIMHRNAHACSHTGSHLLQDEFVV